MTKYLSNAEQAAVLLNKLAQEHDEVGVFWDRGWGDSGDVAAISIITEGNGQKPHATISVDAYRTLLADETIKHNSYAGYKNRRYHAFKEQA